MARPPLGFQVERPASLAARSTVRYMLLLDGLLILRTVEQSRLLAHPDGLPM